MRSSFQTDRSYPSSLKLNLPESRLQSGQFFLDGPNMGGGLGGFPTGAISWSGGGKRVREQRETHDSRELPQSHRLIAGGP